MGGLAALVALASKHMGVEIGVLIPLKAESVLYEGTENFFSAAPDVILGRVVEPPSRTALASPASRPIGATYLC